MQDPTEILSTVATLEAIAKKHDDPVAIIVEAAAANVPEHKATPDLEPYSQSDAIILAVFGSLGKKQQASIIRQALVKPPKGVKAKLEVLTIKDTQNKLRRAHELFTMKKIVGYCAFAVSIAVILAVIGVFLYQVLKNGSMGTSGTSSVIGGLFTTMANVLKIIWSAPTGG